MRLAGVIAGVGLCLAAGGAVAADDPALTRLTQRAQACIRAAAPQVERADASLSSGASFILNNVCAQEIAAHDRYVRGMQMLQMLRTNAFQTDYDDQDAQSVDAAALKKMRDAQGQMRDAYAKATIDPETGEIVMPAGAPVLGSAYAVFANTGYSNTDTSPELRALAGRELLAARLAHLNH